MAELVFYTNPMSRGRIARWMLEEVGAPYETRFVRYGEEMHGADYLAINPMGKVPAIRHGNAVVTECAAICAYLADAFPEAGLAPPAAERAAYYRALFFAAGPVEAATTNQAMGFVLPEDKQASAGYGSFDRMLEGLKRIVGEGPYVCGEQFTAADVYFGSQIGWGLQFGTMPDLPELVSYSERIRVRPAYTRAMELDDAAMAEFGPEMPGS